jgi:hypothetical protein
MEKIVEEIWRNIHDFEGIYQISSLGRVKSLERVIQIKNYSQVCKERILIPRISKKAGYFTVQLCSSSIKKSFYIHRLVASAFIDNSNNYPYVNHKNGTKTDNRVENLEWLTPSQNSKHAFATGLRKVTKNPHLYAPVLKINKTTGEIVHEYESFASAIRELNISSATLHLWLNRQRNNSKFTEYKFVRKREWKITNKDQLKAA